MMLNGLDFGSSKQAAGVDSDGVDLGRRLRGGRGSFGGPCRSVGVPPESGASDPFQGRHFSCDESLTSLTPSLTDLSAADVGWGRGIGCSLQPCTDSAAAFS